MVILVSRGLLITDGQGCLYRPAIRQQIKDKPPAPVGAIDTVLPEELIDNLDTNLSSLKKVFPEADSKTGVGPW